MIFKRVKPAVCGFWPLFCVTNLSLWTTSCYLLHYMHSTLVQNKSCVAFEQFEVRVFIKSPGWPYNQIMLWTPSCTYCNYTVIQPWQPPTFSFTAHKSPSNSALEPRKVKLILNIRRPGENFTIHLSSDAKSLVCLFSNNYKMYSIRFTYITVKKRLCLMTVSPTEKLFFSKHYPEFFVA